MTKVSKNKCKPIHVIIENHFYYRRLHTIILSLVCTSRNLQAASFFIQQIPSLSGLPNSYFKNQEFFRNFFSKSEEKNRRIFLWSSKSFSGLPFITNMYRFLLMNDDQALLHHYSYVICRNEKKIVYILDRRRNIKNDVG